MMAASPGVFDPQLARNLNAVCAGLARAINHGGGVLGGPPMLTEADVAGTIPELLFDVARDAEWVTVPDEFIDDEVLADLQLRPFTVEFNHLREDYQDWFLSHITDSLNRLSIQAATNQEQRNEYVNKVRWVGLKLYLEQAGNPVREAGHAKAIIDGFLKRSKTINTLTALATEASKYKVDGKVYQVTRVQVSRIYNDLGNVSLEIRKAVAAAISEVTPCTADDLLPPNASSPFLSSLSSDS